MSLSTGSLWCLYTPTKCFLLRFFFVFFLFFFLFFFLYYEDALANLKICYHCIFRVHSTSLILFPPQKVSLSFLWFMRSFKLLHSFLPDFSYLFKGYCQLLKTRIILCNFTFCCINHIHILHFLSSVKETTLTFHTLIERNIWPKVAGC